MIKATSATVKNLTSLRGVSLAIELASSVRSRALDGIRRTSHVRLQSKSLREKSNPVQRFIVVTSWRRDSGLVGEIVDPGAELPLPGPPFGCYQLTSVTRELHCVKSSPPTAMHVHLHLR
jgi:hypothetical protein